MSQAMIASSNTSANSLRPCHTLSCIDANIADIFRVGSGASSPYNSLCAPIYFPAITNTGIIANSSGVISRFIVVIIGTFTDTNKVDMRHAAVVRTGIGKTPHVIPKTMLIVNCSV
eukprot:CAMPEP_0202723720 /NCGR_PEP_ID=MMETSP1385-20130828/167823_1 /ASSEMBLY_ACC=CAM_ASM_000861 /TAXON_ID=933848 /ORGANISM="Elphidium margaritaceum" /LENGTH=115 /DNA_ID=CAMNT_0049389021 /DNA_START=116 /DNA_END=460 /DNA_ORIENTATION=-